jgi:hypothetical protein
MKATIESYLNERQEFSRPTDRDSVEICRTDGGLQWVLYAIGIRPEASMKVSLPLLFNGIAQISRMRGAKQASFHIFRQSSGGCFLKHVKWESLQTELRRPN